WEACMTVESLERCPIDGVPLVMISYGTARVGATSVVIMGCPLCDKVVAYYEIPPDMPSGTRQPRGKSSRRSTTFRRKGYSSHGLRFADVQRAFAEAEQLLGTEWPLKGRGHCLRVSLDA